VSTKAPRSMEDLGTAGMCTQELRALLTPYDWPEAVPIHRLTGAVACPGFVDTGYAALCESAIWREYCCSKATGVI
jgi:hypothetical protein